MIAFCPEWTKKGQPALRPLLVSTLNDFADGAKDVEFTNKLGLRETIRITKFEAALYIRASLATKKGIGGLHWRLKLKDYKHMAKVVRGYRLTQNVNGKRYLTDCASYGSKQRLAKLERENENSLLGRALNYPFPFVCKYLGLTPLDDKFREPVISDVPIITFSGALDYRTPVSNATEVLSGFATSTHIIEMDGFHSVCRKPKCLELLERFLAGDTYFSNSQVIEIGN